MGSSCLRIAQLSDSILHALWHVFVLCTLWLRDVQQLQFHLANLIWWPPLLCNDTLLASRAAHCHLLYSPLIEAGDVNGIWTTKCVLLVFAERNVSASEASILPNDALHQLVSG